MQIHKKALRWTAIVLGLFLVASAVSAAILFWRTGSRLQEQIAAIRRAGDPLYLADLAGQPVTPEKNVSTYLARSQDDLVAIETEFRDVVGSDAFDSGLLSPTQQGKVESTFAAHPKVVPLLEQASRCDRYAPALDYAASPSEFLSAYIKQVSDMRAAMRVLKVHGLWLLAKGRPQDALGDSLLMLQLCRLTDQQPLWTGQLVALACRGPALDLAERILQASPLSSDTRKSLDAALAAQDLFAAGRWAIKSERCYGMSYVELVVPGRHNWIMRGYWNRHELLYLTMMDQFLAVTGRPWPDFQRVHQSAVQDTAGWPLLKPLMPIFLRGYAVCLRTEAKIRSLRVLNALQGRSLPANAAIPKLSDLGLPVAATLDPFTGSPLVLERLPEGWLVYSLGQNLSDDGGQLTPDGLKDVGVGPKKLSATGGK